LASAELAQSASNHLVVLGQQTPPAAIAELHRQVRRPSDICEQDCGQKAVGLTRAASHQWLTTISPSDGVVVDASKTISSTRVEVRLAFALTSIGIHGTTRSIRY